ncbi:DNA polymerase delta catalytic subunit [Thraustotheca clavata]|uniref:DNA polymerase n=1 Tax=Thraustotheca clavata TaxID=74557 RepID=A0A1V9ZX62_9STRA|nr:DNA polymerase delta catalytic subunit [Thraustotheca clavata]
MADKKKNDMLRGSSDLKQLEKMLDAKDAKSKKSPLASPLKPEVTLNMEKLLLTPEEEKTLRKQKKKEAMANQTFEKKAKMSKDERRQLQEQQRAAKAGGAKPAAKPSTAPTPPTARMQYDDPKKVARYSKGSVIQRTQAQKQVTLFSHLPQYERESSLSLNVGFSKTEIYPAILSLGLKYAEGKIAGGNARCIAMLTAFQQVIKDYHAPSDKSLRRDLDKTLRPLIQFLIDCRPHSIGMGNAIRYVRNIIATIDVNKNDDEAKTFIIDEIEQYMQHRILLAMKAVSKLSCTKIVDGDVILTYARSEVIESLLKEAHDLKTNFKVIVVDSRPHFEGKKLIRSLANHGLPCSYIHINGLSYVMKQVTKVFLGASAFMSNGAAVARVGTALCAMTAHEFNVPVLFCCETYKFSDRVQLDSITHNELRDPDELISSYATETNADRLNRPKSQQAEDQPHVLADWRDLPNLKLLNLIYDLTPMEFVTTVVTEIGMIPPTSIPAIIREYRKETGSDENAPYPAQMEPPAKKVKKVQTHANGWRRKELGEWNAKEQALRFQWIDIGMYDGEPLAENPFSRTQPIPGPRTGSTSIVRLTGVTEDGHSVMAHIHGFVPYFYASCPEGLTNADCGVVREALDAIAKKNPSDATAIQGVEIVEDKMSLYGYQFDKKVRLMKIYFTLPNIVPRVRTALESGNVHIAGYGTRAYQTYESNVPYILRFMIDNEIQGCNWVEMPAGRYRIRPQSKHVSLCQIEIDVVYMNIVSHAPQGQWGKLAPLRVLSFDIECMGRTGHFPEAEKDPVIQIANVVWEQGAEHPFVRNVFVLGTCKPIVGAHVIEFEKESDMLEAWADFVRQIDPDILTGYNIDNFDIPYLMNRGKALKLQPQYACWGRMRNIANIMEKKSFQSAAYGKSDNIRTTMHGRTSFDMLPIIRRNQQLSSYSLNSVSATFLGQQKEDVPHGIISDLQRGSDDDRHRLAVYCLKDALLPLTLLQKLSYLVNYIEMARVTGVPLDFLIDRGQQIKVYSMLLRKCREASLVVPFLPRAGGGDDIGYEGATVIEPIKAFYTMPIATLDFASLYPSIMQGYNLCYSTLVAPSDVSKLDANAYQTSPSGDVFVTSQTKKGILPLILEELLSARKQAKRDMATAPDAMTKAVQNGRQLALKVSANSVYGFTGANVGQLPCIPIASSVTAYGRQLLFKTREEVEKVFTVANGYKHNAQVVYGDTDSVMVKFGVETVADAMPLAEEAARIVSDIFPKPIKLEFEKVYYPYLLMNKKRYAGLLWTKAEKYDKLDTKGLETVRRDNCMLVRRMVENILKKILIDRDVDAAINYTKQIISDLLQNKVDVSLLVITKGLSKTTDSDDYKAKQAHTELAARMKKRDPGSAPVLGERVAYVIVDKGKNVPLYDRSEDPVYTLMNNIPIDCDYYLTNQLQNPIERLFEPIIGLAKVKSDLFAGDHTRKRSKPGLVQNSGGMMNFAVKKSKCLGCKAPLNGDGALCQSCLQDEAQVYAKQLSVVVSAESQFARLWTQCQNCQGSLHQEVLCTSRDCPIFYKRIKVQKELGEAQASLERFKYEW